MVRHTNITGTYDSQPETKQTKKQRERRKRKVKSQGMAKAMEPADKDIETATHSLINTLKGVPRNPESIMRGMEDIKETQRELMEVGNTTFGKNKPE